MTLFQIEIRVPTNTLDSNKTTPRLVNTATCGIQRVVVGYIKCTVSRMDARTNPNLIVHDKRENLFVRNRVHVADDNKLLSVLH